MSEFKAFMSWTYTPETLAARQRIIDDITRWVLRGAESQYGRPAQHPQHHTLQNAVRARMLEAYSPMMKLTAAQRKRIDEGDTNTMLARIFEEAKKRSGFRRLTTPKFSDKNVSLAFDAHFNTSILPVWIDAEPTVRGAAERALQNLANAETRLICLYALHDLTRMMEHRNEGELAGFKEVFETIAKYRNGFTIQALMFAGMVGGKFHADVVREIALDNCHKEVDDGRNYTLIQYLTEDGVIPGSWGSDQEKALRADIANHYDALKETK